MSDAYDFLLKFLIIGAAGTGKSCLLHRFIEGKFKHNSSHTIGVEFGSKIVPIGNHKVKLQVWDTAGQERFRSVTRSYYRGAAGALLVFDITSRESFGTLGNWLSDAQTLASPDIFILMVGHKSDLSAERQVSYEEASRFAQENGLVYLEASALSGENVDEAFFKCARTILTKIEAGEIDPEKTNSGIQYGSSSLRGGPGNLYGPATTPASSSCSC
ncbi:ras family-domain-containing protein [Catenaria anguillulae PL171]|uniref:Ras family-domain-containing protein n=1 Tax=Catenaria anguillulae PL171 TaxID=765915 RepID=A0A1Y2I5Z0_9FUNG|nr:ras family-domain-containing protein [Catenaria anguillulae PL171]